MFERTLVDRFSDVYVPCSTARERWDLNNEVAISRLKTERAMSVEDMAVVEVRGGYRLSYFDIGDFGLSRRYLLPSLFDHRFYLQ